jgi:serine/threonine protein kinase
VRELSTAEMAPYQHGATWCCTMPSGFVVTATRRGRREGRGVARVACHIQGNSEVDVWSCGVILYALLNARLPFDNDHIPTLFKRIRSGEYSPPLCSPSCADLIQRCLCVDALKRITIPEIREHAWFKIDLPAYLAEPPRDVTELASLPIDDDVVAELQSMLGNDTVSYGEIQQALQQSVAADGTVNPLAVAYNLVYDQRMAADRTAPVLSPTNSTGGAASSLSNPLLLATSPPMNLRLARPFVDVVPPASLLSPPRRR